VIAAHKPQAQAKVRIKLVLSRTHKANFLFW